jgi:hypothetical protein
MTSWSSFTAKQRTVAEQAFDALSLLDALTDHAATSQGVTRKFFFSNLYDFVTGFDSTMDADLERALQNDERLRDDLDRLLDNSARYQAENVAAASTGVVNLRQGKGFEVRLHESQAAPQQTYIIIEFADPNATPPTALFLCGAQATYLKKTLPKPQDGIIQILENSDSDMVVALRAIDTQVFFR